MSARGSHKLEVVRWLLSAAAVAAIHAGAFAALMQTNERDTGEDPAGAMVIEFAEIPVAAANLPSTLAPGPEQIEAKANPEPMKDTEKDAEEKPSPDPSEQPQPEARAASNPKVAVPEQQPKEAEKAVEPPSQVSAPITSAPQALAEKQAAVAAAPRQGVPNHSNSTSLPRWTGKISLLLERNKRYPQAARSKRSEGVVVVSFSLDRDGRLIAGAIKQSSGYETLDQEALAMLHRSQPFPPVPADVAGPNVSLVVPIRFDIR